MDLVNITGRVNVKKYKNGVLVQELEQPNLITTEGKAMVADRMKAVPSIGVITHMGVGVAGSVAAGDTSSTFELTDVATVALDSTTVNAAQITYVATFPAGTGTNPALADGALLTAASGGTLLAHTMFSATINKEADDVLVVTWVITVG